MCNVFHYTIQESGLQPLSFKSAQEQKDLEIPSFRQHKLKRPPLSGYYSIDVSGNYRIVFWFEEGRVSEVDYLDTH